MEDLKLVRNIEEILKDEVNYKFDLYNDQYSLMDQHGTVFITFQRDEMNIEYVKNMLKKVLGLYEDKDRLSVADKSEFSNLYDLILPLLDRRQKIKDLLKVI